MTRDREAKVKLCTLNSGVREQPSCVHRTLRRTGKRERAICWRFVGRKHGVRRHVNTETAIGEFRWA